MGRFERDEIEARRLPTSLGSATEDLRSTIEAEVAKIVERAEARAAEIETRALERAGRMQDDSERRAREVFQESQERLRQMLAEIDAIDRVVSDAIRSLRAETARLTSEIESAREEPLPQSKAVQPSDIIDDRSALDAAEELEVATADESSTAVGETGSDVRESDPADQADTEARTRPNADPEGDPEVREMIRHQLISLAEGGRNRADAERMLLRFRQGEQYFDLLDEIYPEETPGRRGLLRRRKR